MVVLYSFLIWLEGASLGQVESIIIREVGFCPSHFLINNLDAIIYKSNVLYGAQTNGKDVGVVGKAQMTAKLLVLALG